MGVDVETITPGDGKPYNVQTFVSCDNVSITHTFPTPFLCTVYAPGTTFAKKGQTVIVHYTGRLNLL